MRHSTTCCILRNCCHSHRKDDSRGCLGCSGSHRYRHQANGISHTHAASRCRHGHRLPACILSLSVEALAAFPEPCGEFTPPHIHRENDRGDRDNRGDLVNHHRHAPPARRHHVAAARTARAASEKSGPSPAVPHSTSWFPPHQPEPAPITPSARLTRTRMPHDFCSFASFSASHLSRPALYWSIRSPGSCAMKASASVRYACKSGRR